MNVVTEKSIIHPDLWRGVVEVIGKEELEAKLSSSQVLNIKAGFDPTAADIHFGHTVLLKKLRQFQELGHFVWFVVGDFTAMIGDPTGKNTTRPTLEREEILENAKTYQAQALKILLPEKTRFICNSEWFGQMSAQDLIKLTQKYTVARILERDDFHHRYQQNLPISLHEFIYPLLQGHDSVMLKSDLELGGTDQKFNLLVGRELQKQASMKPQAIMTLPLLVGLDGEKKMSKSLNNYIGVTDEPEMMFGKIMSVSDENLWSYLELLSALPLSEIEKRKSAVAAGLNPRDVKMDFAEEMVAQFHGIEAGQFARQAFIDRYQQKKAPVLALTYIPYPEPLPLANLLKQLDLCKSSSEAHRLLQQGAVKIDGHKVAADFVLNPNQPYLLQVGKHRFMHIQLKQD